jgi:uncharacterized YceG family protein
VFRRDRGSQGERTREERERAAAERAARRAAREGRPPPPEPLADTPADDDLPSLWDLDRAAREDGDHAAPPSGEESDHAAAPSPDEPAHGGRDGSPPSFEELDRAARQSGPAPLDDGDHASSDGPPASLNGPDPATRAFGPASLDEPARADGGPGPFDGAGPPSPADPDPAADDEPPAVPEDLPPVEESVGPARPRSAATEGDGAPDDAESSAPSAGGDWAPEWSEDAEPARAPAPDPDAEPELILPSARAERAPVDAGDEPEQEPERETPSLPRGRATALASPPVASAAPRRSAPAPPRRPGAGKAPQGRRRRGGRWRRRFGALLALAAIGAALAFINATFQPFHGDGRGVAHVRIPSGADAGQIGELLEARGVVESARFFNLNATLTLRRSKLKPGNYTLARDMSYGDALDALIQGPEAKVLKTFKLTIPEGLSRREVDPLLVKADLDGDYLQATSSRELLRSARRAGLPRRAKTAEGFLFPATYELPVGADATELADQQVATFRRRLADVNMSTAKRKNLTRYDVLIIASMVEREAQLDRERRLVAAVIYNRLQRGMPLGIDATIRYSENNWTRPLRKSELEKDGPYNTRTRRGLPPTPIGNPGLDSIKAAARPAGVNYLYYVRKPGESGEHAFSSSEDKFLRDVRRYQDSGGAG